jgi:hypothetical protein
VVVVVEVVDVEVVDVKVVDVVVLFAHKDMAWRLPCVPEPDAPSCVPEPDAQFKFGGPSPFHTTRGPPSMRGWASDTISDFAFRAYSPSTRS